MKNSLHLTVSLLALFVGGCASQALVQKDNRALSHSVESVEHFGLVMVVGTTSFEVQSTLGVPDRRLAPDVWAYDGFDGGAAQAPYDNCSVLLLTFKEDRVAEIQLVNTGAERIIMAQLNSPPVPATLIADSTNPAKSGFAHPIP